MTFRLKFGAHDPDYPYLNNDDTRRSLFIVTETKDQVTLQTLNNNYIFQLVMDCLNLDDREEDDQHETWKNSDAFDKDYNRILKHKPSEFNQFWEILTLEVIEKLRHIVMNTGLYADVALDYFQPIRDMVTDDLENFVREEAEELADNDFIQEVRDDEEC